MGEHGLCPKKQASYHCTLSAASRAAWTGEGVAEMEEASAYLISDAMEPENVRREGCPRGWAVSAFARSLALYRRRRAADGLRVSSPLLDRTDDPLILEAISYLEAEEDRHLARVRLDLEHQRAAQRS